MPKYIVEALSQHRMVYCVEAETKDQAEQSVWNGDITEEYGQDHLGEIVVSSREASDDEVVRIFDEVNDYLISLSSEEKLRRVYKVVTK